MPTVSCELTTRGDELDRFGRIPPAVLLRYCEHARWAAIEDPALQLGALFSQDRRIVVRAQRAVFLGHLGVSERVEASVWLARVGRTSVEFGQRIRRVSDGSDIAWARVAAVYVGQDRRPTELPAHVAECVVQEPSMPAELAEWNPPQESAPSSAFIRTFTIRASEIDLFNHVNHANYLMLFDDARIDGERIGGLGPNWVADRPLAACAIDYAKESLLGDTLAALVWPIENGAALGCELRKIGNQTPLCRARLVFQG